MDRFFRLFAILIFCNVKLFAAENYIEYHKQIIKAESYFLNGQFDSSISQYAQIFSKYKKAFAKDCYIALQIAAIRNDTINAELFCLKGFQFGVNWNILFVSEPIADLLNSHQQFANRIKKQYSNYRKIYENSIDTNLRNRIFYLIERDNKNRAITGLDKASQDSIYSSIQDTNLRDLISIVNKIGYPGEHIIGVYDYDFKYSKDSYNPLRLSSIPSIMFFHDCYAFHFLKKELYNAIVDGELLPSEYALIYDWSYSTIAMLENAYDEQHNVKKGYKNYFLPTFKLKSKPEKRDKYYNMSSGYIGMHSDTALVNSCRKEIGMASIEHEKIKRAFEKKYNIHLFFGLFENL